MTASSIEISLDDNSQLNYFGNFLDPESSDSLLECFLNTVAWEQSRISLFGKQYAIPRLNAWYGDEPYSYSGTHFSKRDWTPELLSIKNRIEEQTGIPLNCVLVNLYRSGLDCMGWHRDNEKSLGPQPQIASVSLGSTRRFLLRNKSDKKNKHTLELAHGSLLLMRGRTQLDWEHSLPRTRKVIEPRINLTFRYSYPE